MDYHGLDLNLLVSLQVLLTERHVTRSAEKLGITQPAMSASLARLRAPSTWLPGGLRDVVEPGRRAG